MADERVADGDRRICAGVGVQASQSQRDLSFEIRDATKSDSSLSPSFLAPSLCAQLLLLRTMSLYVCVTGYTDAPGHTEYIITTDFEDTSGKRHSVSKMHRFSAFQDLHADIQLKLGLPTTLPVAKTLMTTSAVKDERVVKFQEYLRNAVAKCGSEPHPALCRFLGVDPKAVDGSKTIGPSATGGAPSSGGGGGSSSSPSAAAAPRTFCESSFFFGGASAAGEAAAAGALPEDLNDGLREGIKNGDTQLCLELIKKGADANHRDRQGSYPLHMACLFQRTEVVKALLAAGADIEKQNAAGELPTKIANVTLKMKMLKFKETGNFGLA